MSSKVLNKAPCFLRLWKWIPFEPWGQNSITVLQKAAKLFFSGMFLIIYQTQCCNTCNAMLNNIVCTVHKAVSSKAADTLPTEPDPVMSIYCRLCGSYRRSDNYYEIWNIMWKVRDSTPAAQWEIFSIW
jgi:hypothetical protein